MVYSNKYKFRKLRGTVQDSINEERARQNEDFNRKLKNAEDSMKAIYPEEYLKIRSRYFGNGNNLGLIGSQFNYIHNMITRNSDDQMKKYYNELNDYFIKQTGTEPGYMLPGVDVVDEAPDFNALRQKDFDRFYSPTENSDYINTVEKENARNAYLALQNKNADGTFDHDGYFDYDPNNGLLNTEANYARATGSYNYTPEERKAAATWERAENSPIITAMEFSPLFPVVAGVKAVAAANAPQASGVDVGMNAAFIALPAIGTGVKAINNTRKLIGKQPRTATQLYSTHNGLVDWDPDKWFKEISGRASYTQDEAKELLESVPEYREIENRLLNNGELIINNTGNVTLKNPITREAVLDEYGNVVIPKYTMSPQEYIMRNSKNFKKLNSDNHFVGINKDFVDDFKNNKEIRDYDTWTSEHPEDVIEYAQERKGSPTSYQKRINRLNDGITEFQKELDDEITYITNNFGENDPRRDFYIKKAKDKWGDLINENTTKIEELRKNIEQTGPLQGGEIISVTYPKSSKEYIVDANGSNWDKIKHSYSKDVEPSQTTTDHIVNSNRLLKYDVSKINNVMDTWDGNKINETIIHRETPIKTVLGNTGKFDITGKNKWNIYRAVGYPLSLGVGYKLLNDTNNQGQDYRSGDVLYQPVEEYKSGGIHINPKNEGKFTESANITDGGVLDATYNEQINRIRKPRFSGWSYRRGGSTIGDRKRGNERQRNEFEQMSAARNAALPESEEIVNVDDAHEWKRTHWGEVDKAPTGNKMYGDVYTINNPESYDRKKRVELKRQIREEFPDAKIKYDNGSISFRVPYVNEDHVNLSLISDDYYTPEINKPVVRIKRMPQMREFEIRQPKSNLWWWTNDNGTVNFVHGDHNNDYYRHPEYNIEVEGIDYNQAYDNSMPEFMDIAYDKEKNVYVYNGNRWINHYYNSDVAYGKKAKNDYITAQDLINNGYKIFKYPEQYKNSSIYQKEKNELQKYFDKIELLDKVNKESKLHNEAFGYEPQQQVYNHGGVLDATYREQIDRIRQHNDEQQYYKSGGIHIKESHRGRLTRLKERTGKSEEELYRTGDESVRKMITFARNARKWKHADGGDVPPFKSFDDWYRSIYHNANDTTDYNLRRAYELAPIGELEAWRSDPDKNHLHTGYWNGDVYEFMKSKNHPTVGNELDWYNSPDADDFRSRYMLDTITGNYKYVPRYKVKVTF